MPLLKMRRAIKIMLPWRTVMPWDTRLKYDKARDRNERAFSGELLSFGAILR